MHQGRCKAAPVEPGLYDRTYFLHHCGGYEAYARSGGTQLDPRLAVIFQMAGVQPGMRALDLGCGRGELVRHSASVGAFVWGMDLSREALAISRETLDKLPAEHRHRGGLTRANAETLPFTHAAFDRVLLSDLLEHLTPHELERMLREVHRVLRPNGLIVFHTFPNRWFYDIYYPMKRLLWDGPRGRAGPRDPRTPYERWMHVNELSPQALIGILRPLFAVEIWCAHRDHWDPEEGRFRKGKAPLDWITQPEIWGVGVKRRV